MFAFLFCDANLFVSTIVVYLFIHNLYLVLYFCNSIRKSYRNVDTVFHFQVQTLTDPASSQDHLQAKGGSASESTRTATAQAKGSPASRGSVGMFLPSQSDVWLYMLAGDNG